MRLRIFSSLLLLFFPVPQFLAPQFHTSQLAAQASSNAQKFSPPSRTFRFTYNVTVKDIPAGAKRCASGFRCRRLTGIRPCAFWRSRPRLKRG